MFAFSDVMILRMQVSFNLFLVDNDNDECKLLQLQTLQLGVNMIPIYLVCSGVDLLLTWADGGWGW